MGFLQSRLPPSEKLQHPVRPKILIHLIDEIEGLAGHDRSEVENRLDVLLAHLLKRLYVDSPADYRDWKLTIREQQKRLRRLLKQSPSLSNYLVEVFDEVWQDVLNDVQKA